MTIYLHQKNVVKIILDTVLISNVSTWNSYKNLKILKDSEIGAKKKKRTQIIIFYFMTTRRLSVDFRDKCDKLFSIISLTTTKSTFKL